MEFETLKDQVNIKKLKRHSKGKFASVINDWLETEDKTLVFKLTNRNEYGSCRACAYQHKERLHEDFVIYSELPTLRIYLVRP